MYFITTKRMLEVCFSAHPNIQYRTYMILLTETILSRLILVANTRQYRYNSGLIRIQCLAHLVQRTIIITELRVYITQQNNWVFRNGTHNFYLLSITSY